MESFIHSLRALEKRAHTMVWWKPEQRERGDHLRTDTLKGERPWMIPETTGRFLYDMIRTRGVLDVLELGTSIGYSTLWIAQGIFDNLAELRVFPEKSPRGHIDTVEHSHNKVPVATEHFKAFQRDHLITLHAREIRDFLPEIPLDVKYDLIFLDADRGHYHEYLPWLELHMEPGCIIVADNAHNMQARMQPFLELLHTRNFKYDIIDLDHGLLVAQKNP